MKNVIVIIISVSLFIFALFTLLLTCASFSMAADGPEYAIMGIFFLIFAIGEAAGGFLIIKQFYNTQYKQELEEKRELELKLKYEKLAQEKIEQQVELKLKENGISPTILTEDSGFDDSLYDYDIKDFDYQKERELLESLKNATGNPLTTHDCYLELQNFYYRYRELSPSYLNSCIDYCVRDIEIYNAAYNELIKQRTIQLEKMIKSGSYTSEKIEEFKKEEIKLSTPSFKRLAIIFEKAKQYKQAIEICDLATRNGFFDDGTKNGFEGRKKRLITKIQEN